MHRPQCAPPTHTSAPPSPSSRSHFTPVPISPPLPSSPLRKCVCRDKHTCARTHTDRPRRSAVVSGEQRGHGTTDRTGSATDDGTNEDPLLPPPPCTPPHTPRRALQELITDTETPLPRAATLTKGASSILSLAPLAAYRMAVRSAGSAVARGLPICTRSGCACVSRDGLHPSTARNLATASTTSLAVHGRHGVYRPGHTNDAG